MNYYAIVYIHMKYLKFDNLVNICRYYSTWNILPTIPKPPLGKLYCGPNHITKKCPCFSRGFSWVTDFRNDLKRENENIEKYEKEEGYKKFVSDVIKEKKHYFNSLNDSQKDGFKPEPDGFKPEPDGFKPINENKHEESRRN